MYNCFILKQEKNTRDNTKRIVTLGISCGISFFEGLAIVVAVTDVVVEGAVVRII